VFINDINLSLPDEQVLAILKPASADRNVCGANQSRDLLNA
jgi:hypothetical protein